MRYKLINYATGRVIKSDGTFAGAIQACFRQQIGTICDLFRDGKHVDVLVPNVTAIWHKGRRRTPGLITETKLVKRAA